MSNNEIKKLKETDAENLFDTPNLVFMAENSLSAIDFFKKITRSIEKEVTSQVRLRKEFEMLLTITGVGDVLGLIIMLEVGGINRFEQVGDYSSYSRCVKSERFSNGRKKGGNNKKNGNKYLGCGAEFVELHPRVRVTHTKQRGTRIKFIELNLSL